jgi:hypothetical protein
MNTKITLSTLIAAATLAAGGFAVAQSTPPTSTPGAGCTATANAMRGGNLGGQATNKECGTADTAKTAAAPAGPATTETTTSAGAADSSTMGNTGATAAPARVAKADRN